jgi:hypothetical protein
MRRLFAVVVCSVLWPSIVLSYEGPYKVETIKESPPTGVAGPIKDTLEPQAIRILDEGGKLFATVWLRKAIPAGTKPGGPKGAVLFPFLAEGELLGVLQFASEGHDYRDQSIATGVYTLRYGLQPVNGDHLGVSTYRDYALLVPSAKDQAVEAIPQKVLEKKSTEAAGSNHPAVLLLIAAPASAKSGAAIQHDEAKNLWGVTLPLSVSVKGEQTAAPFTVQLIVVGAAMT